MLPGARTAILCFLGLSSDTSFDCLVGLEGKVHRKSPGG